MFEPNAKIIADSVNPWGTRLTTYELTYHRLIHSEFMTHRVLSKNSSSSRAIPVERMISKVITDNVRPLYWGKNKKGMSTREEVDEESKLLAVAEWDEAREDAIRHAKKLTKIGIHKQVVNRLLEPFSPITVVCSGTEFQNFFEQRCHEDAQPEIQALAHKMRKAYTESSPKEMGVGQWHIPFIDPAKDKDLNPEQVLAIAVGRCARVSYLTHDGIRDPQEDINLFDRLWNSKPKHLSPLEHVARVAPWRTKNDNFDEWASLRHELRVGTLKYKADGMFEGGCYASN